MILQRKIKYKENIESLIAYNDFQIESVIACLVESKKAIYDSKKGKLKQIRGVTPDLWFMKYRVELHWVYETRKMLFTQYLGRVPTRKELRRKFMNNDNKPFEYGILHDKFNSLKFNIKL